MKLAASLMITKTAARMSRLLGRGSGQALPGLLAERLDPHLAGKLAAGLPHGVILVTGTNGKTTTTKLIKEMLEANGERVLTNSTGSNLKRGITSALIEGADIRGHLNSTIGLFEVDEASLRRVAPELQPQHIVVLNLFRDQLDRYGELDTTAALIGQGIAATTADLHLNADDPLVASLAKYASKTAKVTWFGVEGLPARNSTAQTTATDSDRCPLCRSRLIFSRVFYGHIGHYRCPQGDFTRPQPDVAVTNVAEASLDGTKFTVAVDGKRSEVRFPLAGTYNLYNAVAAMAVSRRLGVSEQKVGEVLRAARAAFGRVEQVEIDGKTLVLLLIKNPAGFTQVLETFLVGRPGLAVMMAINDLDADGRDVSWLWDVPLELLEPGRPWLVAAGIRATDMSLRLHYAGLEAKTEANMGLAVQSLLDRVPAGGTGYVLPTYTAMLDLRKLMSKITHIPEAGK